MSLQETPSRDQPQPPATASDGEVADLVEFLRVYGDHVMDEFGDVGEHDQLTRAAELLEQCNPAQAAVPVPVDERPWQREGWCDAEGFLWLWDCDRRWVRQMGTAGACNTWTGSFALPHWAIPVPQPPQGGEVAE